MALTDKVDPTDDPKVVPADPRDTELDPKGDEETKPEEEAEDVESEGESEEEGSEEEADDEEESEKKAEPEVDISKIPLDELLKRDDFKRFVQSTSDKAVAAAERRANEQRAKEREEIRRRREEEELDELFEAEDFEAVGKRAKEQRDKAKQDAAEYQRWGGEFSRAGELHYREVYADLGEETLDRVFGEMAGKPVFDLGSRLAEERLTRTMGDKISERVSAEIEARLAEAGVKARSTKVEKKETASEEVSGSKKSKPVRAEKTASDWVDSYNDGEVAFEELPADVKKKLSK